LSRLTMGGKQISKLVIRVDGAKPCHAAASGHSHGERPHGPHEPFLLE
jgi:hypothetical protein